MDRLAIVVPCYNEEEMLPITTKELTEVLDNLIRKEKVAKDSYILYVDDGSKDATWELIEKLHKEAVCLGVKEFQISYSYYENGDRAMPIDVLERLAAYYNTSMDYLVERTDVKKAYPPGKSIKK